jgi:hypothetical protein
MADNRIKDAIRKRMEELISENKFKQEIIEILTEEFKIQMWDKNLHQSIPALINWSLKKRAIINYDI